MFRRNFPDLGELGNDPVEGLTDQLAPAAERGIGDDHQAARIRVLQEVQVDLERLGSSLLKFYLNTKSLIEFIPINFSHTFQSYALND